MVVHRKKNYLKYINMKKPFQGAGGYRIITLKITLENTLEITLEITMPVKNLSKLH